MTELVTPTVDQNPLPDPPPGQDTISTPHDDVPSTDTISTPHDDVPATDLSAYGVAPFTGADKEDYDTDLGRFMVRTVGMIVDAEERASRRAHHTTQRMLDITEGLIEAFVPVAVRGLDLDIRIKEQKLNQPSEDLSRN